jgi:beta-galactosidase
MLGVDYYPEHWPLERLEMDLKIMKENGLHLLRIGEFMWSKLEPKEDEYDFSLLDRVFQLCATSGLKIVLGTPSATPPAWLVRKHPGILQKDAYGRERPFGSRRHYCLNSDTYMFYVQKIVLQLAKRYGSSDCLYAWQIDNEFGCEDTSYCYCEKCDRAFRSYLEKKYKVLPTLNQAWGTAFWSQDYYSFQEIQTPRQTNARLNPTQVLDFYRFSTDSATHFAERQIATIRNFSKAPVTHNFMVNFTELDYFEHQKIYDFISYDNYQPFERYDPYVSEFNFDLIWSLKKKPFTVMEQQPGRVNWQKHNQYYPVEWLKQTTRQAFEHGADNVVYFRYRPFPAGAEQYHTGILNYDGNPQTSKRLTAVKELFTESLTPKKKPSRTGIFFDYENTWMHEINYVSEDLVYIEKVYELYCVLRRLGYDVQFFFKDANLNDFERVFFPYAISIPDSIRRQMKTYQGKMLLTCATDIKNENNHIRSDNPLGIRLPGLSFVIHDFGAISPDLVEFVIPGFMKENTSPTVKGNLWYEEIDIQNGNIWGSWSGKYSGPAVISSEDGRILYIGTCLDTEALYQLLQFWLRG